MTAISSLFFYCIFASLRSNDRGRGHLRHCGLLHFEVRFSCTAFVKMTERRLMSDYFLFSIFYLLPDRLTV